MKSVLMTTAIGLGDIINLKGTMDPIKDQYSKIRVNFHRKIINQVKRNQDYNKFLDDIGQLFFSEHPYVLDDGNYPLNLKGNPFTDNGIRPTKPNLAHILCKGSSLNESEEYIVITTKIRSVDKKAFYPLSTKLLATLKDLTKKYKIVILGERTIEMNADHISLGPAVYSIYELIIANIPMDRLVDCTFSALGISSPSLSQIQQDCLIMKEAKFIVTIGIGGNFTMANAVGNTIGFRSDHDSIGDMIYDGKQYPNNIITRDWEVFISKLREHL